MKIAATKEQIELIIKDKKDELFKKYERDVKELEKEYSNYTFEINDIIKGKTETKTNTETKPRKERGGNIDVALITQFYNEGLTIKEMLKQLPNVNEASLRTKLNKEGLKMKDQPKKQS